MEFLTNIIGVAIGLILGEVIFLFFKEDIIRLKQRYNYWKSEKRTQKKIKRKKKS